MTHTLHRNGDSADLRDDFVMLIMGGPDRMKHEGVRERMGEIWDILSRYQADLGNYGTLRGGGILKPIEDLKRQNPWMIHAVFSSREALRSCLRELEARDLGISVAISGCGEDIRTACAESGLTPHTIQHSLGVYGKREKLPDENTLAIATMCGHAMVSRNLIAHVVEGIAKGKMTHAEGAAKLTRMCDCGVFNRHKAERLLRQIV
jgi:hypothetical protein